MRVMHTSRVAPTCFTLLLLHITTVLCAADPLPSWNEGPARQAILNFVSRVTTPNTPDYVPPADRIATFDNDGTLWSEQPMYFQMAFAIDSVKALAPQHPEWAKTQPFQAILEGDLKTLIASGEKGIVQVMMATHAGMTTAEFKTIVTNWLKTARHPRFHRPYNELIFQPMVELLAYLRANGFKTYIVSGGGIEFMRPWVEHAYGIPPEQVVGSSIKLRYELRDGQPVLVRLPEVDFVDDKAGKPVGIEKFIGKRPLASFGNSDGDYEMLRWCTSAPGPRLGLIVHHTDAQREYAYDRNSHIGQLNKTLDEAPQRGWLVVNMKRDWKRIYSFDE